MKATRSPSPQRVDPVEVEDRKADHIRLALEDRMQLGISYFEDYYFEHHGLPELAMDEVDLSASFLDRRLAAPLVISCMTGGTAQATLINRNLAAAAEECRIAIGVGSQRKALEDASQAASFQIRSLAPSVPLLANLGAVQLNYGFGLDECRAAVEMIEADALVFHLNPLQEAIQPEGQCDFSGLIGRLGEIADRLPVPVIVKEIGCGISASAAEALKAQGIRIIDCAGLGGTTWARIEGRRAGDEALGEVFAGWGIPTPVSIREVAAVPGLTVIGSGGVRNGLDAAKAIALGADLAGLAQPFLAAATESAEKVTAVAQRISRELRIAMFCAGAGSLATLKQVGLRQRSET